MNPAIDNTVRSRWLAGLVHGGLWVLIYLVITGLNNDPPPFRLADGSAAPPASEVPVDKISTVFSTPWPSLTPGSNQPNPFWTPHFTPAPAPPPPAPTTRKVQLAYLGFFEADGSRKQAILKMGDKFMITELGTVVTANLYAAMANVTNAWLTNSTGQTNLLPLNQTKELEVPIK